jgi:hypothetical protein
VQPLGAVGEHGRCRLSRVQATHVDFSDVRDEVRFGMPGAGEEISEALEQLVVRNGRELREMLRDRALHTAEYKQRGCRERSVRVAVSRGLFPAFGYRAELEGARRARHPVGRGIGDGEAGIADPSRPGRLGAAQDDGATSHAAEETATSS